MNAKPITSALCIILSLSFALAACSPEAANPALSATLSELEGTVGIKQPGQADFSQASGDATLQQDGQVQTGDDGRVRLDLSSGTIIRMAPSSIFTLLSNEETEGGLVTTLQLEAGKVFIILNGGSMDVETPSGVASVRGSYMSVWVDPDTLDVYVTCLEGDCHAENEAGGTDITDGQKTILFVRRPDGTYTLPEVDDMTPEDFQDWLDENPEAQELFDLAAATMTAMAPTEAPEVTPEPVATEPPVVLPPQGGGGGGCVEIIEPRGGSELPHNGKVTFAWSEHPGAARYQVIIHNTQNGGDLTFNSNDALLTPYIENLPDGGNYSWEVKALDASGNEICKSEPITFDKPSSHPEDLVDPKPEPECDPCDEGGQCYDPENPACYMGQGGFLPGAYYPILYTFPFRPVLIAFPHS